MYRGCWLLCERRSRRSKLSRGMALPDDWNAWESTSSRITYLISRSAKHGALGFLGDVVRGDVWYGGSSGRASVTRSPIPGGVQVLWLTKSSSWMQKALVVRQI